MRAMAAAGRFPAPGNLKPGSAPHPDREPGSVRDLPAGLSPCRDRGAGLRPCLDPGFAPCPAPTPGLVRARIGSRARPGRGRAGGLVRDAVGHAGSSGTESGLRPGPGTWSRARQGPGGPAPALTREPGLVRTWTRARPVPGPGSRASPGTRNRLHSVSMSGRLLSPRGPERGDGSLVGGATTARPEGPAWAASARGCSSGGAGRRVALRNTAPWAAAGRMRRCS